MTARGARAVGARRPASSQARSELHMAALGYAAAVDGITPRQRLPRLQHAPPDLTTAERRLYNAAINYTRAIDRASATIRGVRRG